MSTRPFFDTARDIRRGGLLEDCADELQKVVKAVEETGKPAKLTITHRLARLIPAETGEEHF